MEQKLSFEAQLNKYRVIVERYINFRLPSKFDADDVIQETYYADKSEKGGIRGNEISCGFHANFLFDSGQFSLTGKGGEGKNWIVI